MTALKQILIERITSDGPISIAEYMTECLMHPTHGYYSTRDPFGQGGDFITAPEISQMFGELLGLCLAQTWLDQGAPNRFILTELGPGRGTLMADVLRATKGVPGFLDAAELHLVETSAHLRAEQTKILSTFQPQWHDTLDNLPNGPLFLLANEFFDALPIRQFERTQNGWSERRIGIKGDQLSFGRTPPQHVAALSHRLEDTKPGDLVELCPAAGQISATLATRIAKDGGAALLFDYGDWRSLGDTLQALRDHAPEGVLVSPGAADLTAHVDFEALANSIAPTGKHSRVTPQGIFLERLGITARAQALAGKMQGEALKMHIAAHRRLTHPQEMGTLFKTMAIVPNEAALPPGYEQ
ncbi:MAG: SAM-dependent methyltransferase [Pseudoruegeria sp.]